MRERALVQSVRRQVEKAQLLGHRVAAAEKHDQPERIGTVGQHPVDAESVLNWDVLDRPAFEIEARQRVGGVVDPTGDPVDGDGAIGSARKSKVPLARKGRRDRDKTLVRGLAGEEDGELFGLTWVQPSARARCMVWNSRLAVWR